MYIVIAVVAVLLIVLASAELFLAQFNADELSNMGVEKQWSIPTPILPKPGGYRIIQPGFFYLNSLSVIITFSQNELSHTFIL